MGNTSIQWTDKTWSPIRARVRPNAAAIAARLEYSSLVQIAEKMAGRVGPHCEKVSAGCENCYSQTNNHRCLPANGTGLPFDRRSRDLVETFVDEFILRNPLDWKKPVKVFVENQSDLFGEWVTDEQIDRVFAVMALCPRHTFQVLTKRPERMLRWFHHAKVESPGIRERVWSVVHMMPGYDREHPKFIRTGANAFATWPLPNVWLGVSVEDQATADARVDILRQIPAALRFISQEPQLGNIDWHPLALAGISWAIVGGESGPGARPFDVEWARKTVEQCEAAGVACFVKQLGAKPFDTMRDLAPWLNGVTGGTKPEGWEEGGNLIGPWTPILLDRKGGDALEWPEDLRVREFPEASNAR